MAPRSHGSRAVAGRTAYRWSTAGHGEWVRALIAGLPGWGEKLSVEPPLGASGLNSGLCAPRSRAQVLSRSKLLTLAVGVPPTQSPSVTLLATIVLVRSAVPARNPSPKSFETIVLLKTCTVPVP